MNAKLLTGVATAALLAASGAAAQGASDYNWQDLGWYGAADFGYHWPSLGNGHSTGLAPDGAAYNYHFRENNDWAGFGRLGYRFTPHVRAEIEGGYRQSGFNSIVAPGGISGGASVARPLEPYGLCSPSSVSPGCVRPSGWVDTYTVMANVIFDLNPKSRWFDPFVGAGAGLNHTEFHGNTVFGNVPNAITPTNPAVQSLRI